MMIPVFSIITVTYNASFRLERTIQSILSQSWPHIEYIIIDGASTDGTQEIIRNYESGIAKWISEPDKGLYDAMNKGLRFATGDYVWFINAGDTIHNSTSIEQIISQLATVQLQPAIIYGETEIMDAAGHSLGMRRLKAPEILTWKSFKMGMLVCHQSFIVKREIAEEYDLKYKYTADYDWCIRCMKKADTIFNTRRILSSFMEAGLSAANRKDSLKERYRIMCENYGKLPTQFRHLWFAVRFYAAKWIKRKI
jgi:glycosyltransferase involved in cell wall biosynthesis